MYRVSINPSSPLGSTETTESYNWTPKSKLALGKPGNKSYKTKKAAAKACAKKGSCTGYTKYKEGVYKINTGSGVVVNSKATAYVRGGYASTEHTIFFASK